MYRFIALVWNEEGDSSAGVVECIRNKICSEPTSWVIAYKNSGLIVFHTSEYKERMQAYALGDSAGVILGKLFNKSPCGDHTPINNNFSEGILQKILMTDGKYLVEHYWGRYIAFLRCRETRQISILKSPVEGFDCNFIQYKGVTVYFSFLEDIYPLEIFNLRFNWNHIKRHVKYFLLNKSDTAFNELFKLQAGESRQHKQGEITSVFHWNPVKISRESENIEDPFKAAQLLRREVVGCVSAWAEGCDKILHTLSGGLDSSIILACLMESRNQRDVICINYFPKSDKSGDERYFAGLMAKHYGVQLIEKELDPAQVNMEELFGIHPSSTPELYLTFLDRGPYEVQIAKELGADIIFNGEGGDAVFFQPPTHFPASDYFQMHGLNSMFFKVALNAARLMRKSLGHILYNVIRDSITKSSLSKLNLLSLENSTVLCSNNMQNIRFAETLDSRLKSANDLPYGKQYYISMTDMPNRYYHTANTSMSLESCSPLLSQPIIELCLKIPSYVLTTGGKDRGLARMAFRHDLPREILRRESKGGISNYVQEILQNNIEFIKENLLHGLLVKEKILDQDSLERVLLATKPSVDFEFVNILRHICTEIWFRKTIEKKAKNHRLK